MLSIAKAWFTALSTSAKIGVVSAAVITGGVTTAAVNNTSPPPKAPAVVQTCTETKTTTSETQPVPFAKTSVDDPSTTKGKTYIKTAGVDGVKTIAYDVITYSPSGCKPDTKTQTKEEVTTPATDEVTAVGTYVYVAPQPVCTNGSYVNVDGNTVCSPTTTDNGGATARCVDGTYSYSQNRSGTCSHHGGVSVWY